MLPLSAKQRLLERDTDLPSITGERVEGTCRWCGRTFHGRGLSDYCSRKCEQEEEKHYQDAREAERAREREFNREFEREREQERARGVERAEPARHLDIEIQRAPGLVWAFYLAGLWLGPGIAQAIVLPGHPDNMFGFLPILNWLTILVQSLIQITIWPIVVAVLITGGFALAGVIVWRITR